MGFSLPKKGIRYQQVVGQRKVQNILPLLTPATIPKTPVHPLEPYISHTHMAVEISFYEEFLADRHGTDHTIQIFPELLLGALTKAYLRGIGTDHIHSRISNYYPDQDNPVALPSNIYDSILKTEASGCVGTSSSFPPGVTKTRHHNSQGAALKATTKLSIPYFS